MSAPKNAEKLAVKIAISEHLKLYGPREWPDFFDKYPNVSKASMWRWIKEVKDDLERATIDGGMDLKLMQKRIRSNASPERSSRELKKHIPVAPSPTGLVGLGSENVGEVFIFLEQFNELVRDMKMLRKHSVELQADGEEKIKNPMLFDRSLGRRLELLETWLHSQDMVWNLERMQELYMMIIEEVGKVDADTQQAILSRIRTLNNKRGLTIDARLY